MHRNFTNQKYSAATAKKICIEFWMKPLREMINYHFSDGTF